MSFEYWSVTNFGFINNNRLIEAFRLFGIQLSHHNFSITTENYIVFCELVKSGAGIGIMPEGIGELDPLVQRVLLHVEPMVSEVWLVAHRDVKTNKRIRFVFDFLDQELHKFYQENRFPT